MCIRHSVQAVHAVSLGFLWADFVITKGREQARLFPCPLGAVLSSTDMFGEN